MTSKTLDSLGRFTRASRFKLLSPPTTFTIFLALFSFHALAFIPFEYFYNLLKKLFYSPNRMNLCLAFAISSVQFSRSVVSDSLRPHESQQTRPPCPSPTPGVHSNSCQLSRWCHPTISSSVVPFSSCPQSLPASESFPISQLFAWGGQSIGVSALASVLPMNTQDWSPLG